jgi:Ser/Thr protein kinase RdoA (MazF antagonist)
MPAPPDAAAVAEAFGLARPVGLTTVAGAWSNRVFRLDTAAGSYAVKELTNLWSEPRFGERLDEAWRFELAALAAGVAAPEPIRIPGSEGCALELTRADGSAPATVRVHRWVEGAPAPPAPVAADVARWAGRTLALLHGLRRAPADRGLFPVPDAGTADRWAELTEAARRAGVAWAELLARAAAAVATVAALVRAGGHDPAAEVMSHADVSAKNLVLTSGGPVLCDWDVATPVVPRRELADAAMSLGAWEDHATAREVIRAYRDAGGSDEAIAPPDLGAALASRLDWIALNVEVALGLLPATAERRVVAEELVQERLRSLPHRVETALCVDSTLSV